MDTEEVKLPYDSIIYFNSTPITIINDEGNKITIHGILYKRQAAHDDDLYLGFFVNRYICYLMASEIVQQKGGQLAPDFWELPNGNKITLQLPHKNLIYKIMRDRMLEYRIIETDGALDLKEDEFDGSFLISKNPLLRMGIKEPQNKRELEEAGKEVKS